MMIIMSCLLCFEFITMTRTTDFSMSKLGQKYKVKICNLFVQIIISSSQSSAFIIFYSIKWIMLQPINNDY